MTEKNWLLVKVPTKEAEKLKEYLAEQNYEYTEGKQTVKAEVENLKYDERYDYTAKQVKEMLLEWFATAGIQPTSDLTIGFRCAANKVGDQIWVLGIDLSDKTLEEQLKQELSVNDLEEEMETARGRFDLEIIEQEEEFQLTLKEYQNSLKKKTDKGSQSIKELEYNILKQKIKEKLPHLVLKELPHYEVGETKIFALKFLSENETEKIFFIFLNVKAGEVEYRTFDSFLEEEVKTIAEITEEAITESQLKSLFEK